MLANPLAPMVAASAADRKIAEALLRARGMAGAGASVGAGVSPFVQAPMIGPAPAPVLNVGPPPQSMEAIARDRERALAMRDQEFGPIESPLELAGNLAQMGVGQYMADRADEREAEARKARTAALAAAMQSPDPITSLMQSDDPELNAMGIEFAMQGMLKPGERWEDVVDPRTGRLMGQRNAATNEYNPIKAGGDAPSGYTYTDDGNLSFIPGGPADPAARRALALAGRVGGGSGGGGAGLGELQNSGLVGFDADGNPLGPVRYNKSAGEYQVMNPDGGWRNLAYGETVRPPGTAAPLNQNQFFKLQSEYNTEYGALTKLNRYFETQGDTNTGIQRWADAISANVTTLLGDGNLNPEELALQVAEGQVQGLLGLFREDVVGPGVMTEYDAKRVLAALGGDVSAFQNREVMATLLYDIYQSKLRRVQTLSDQLGLAAPYHDAPPGTRPPPAFGDGADYIFNPETGRLEPANGR